MMLLLLILVAALQELLWCALTNSLFIWLNSSPWGVGKPNYAAACGSCMSEHNWYPEIYWRNYMVHLSESNLALELYV